MKKKVLIIGGLGHIGLAFAAIISDFYDIFLYDTNENAKKIFLEKREATFFEPGLNEILKKNSNITITDDISITKKCSYIIVTIGTPVDEYLNPKLKQIFSLFKELSKILVNQTIIIKSTLYPGMTKKLEKILHKNVKVAFCPERVIGGNMIQELKTLPQIISANSLDASNSASMFFKPLKTKQMLLTNTTEGELAKLFINAYRYINFALANKFYMLAVEAKCNFNDIFNVITTDYSRLKDLPKPFFSSGYCLPKDTLQLVAWDSCNFQMGLEAFIVNERFPLFVFRKLREKFKDIDKKTIGLLGLSFKADIDDIRNSLAFKMKKILENECKKVLCSDPFYKASWVVDEEELINNSDIIIITCNHSKYRTLTFKKPVLDIINYLDEQNSKINLWEDFN